MSCFAYSAPGSLFDPAMQKREAKRDVQGFQDLYLGEGGWGGMRCSVGFGSLQINLWIRPVVCSSCLHPSAPPVKDAAHAWQTLKLLGNEAVSAQLW